MDSLITNKISTLIQFAYRGNKITFGEAVILKMMTNRIKVMILANDVAPSQEKKYLDKALFYNVQVVRYLSKSDLGSLFNKNEVACVGIEDQNISKEIIRITK